MAVLHQHTWIYKTLRILIILLFIHIACETSLFSQQVSDSENLFVTAYTTENGLRQSMVSQVCQDQRGLIWMVTGDGLHYFDGQEFRAFRVPYNDVNTHTDNVMRYLAFSSDGGLTLSSTSSLLRFNTANAHFSFLYRKEGIYPVVLNTSVDRMPLVWLPGINFCLVKNNKLLPLQFIQPSGESIPPDFVPVNAVRAGANKILIGGEKGIVEMYLDNRPADSIFSTTWIPLANCRAVAKTYSGKTLVLAGSKIYTWQKGGKLSLFTDTRLENLKNLFTDSNQNIWLTDQSYNKLYRLKAGKLVEIKLFTRIGRSTESITPSIISIFEDREKNLWFGTDGNGLLLYSPGLVQFQKANIGFIRSVAGFNNNIWAGTFNNGLWELSPDLSRASRINPAHFDNTVYFLDFVADNSGRLWIATRDGIEVVNQKGISTWNYPLKCEHAKFILKGGDSLFMVSDGQLLRFRISATPFCYHIEDYIAARELVDAGGFYWVATKYGLYRYSKNLGFNQSRAFQPAEHKLSAIPVYALLYHKGLVWAATGNGILCYREDGKMQKLPGCFSQLSNEVIYSILADVAGRLWITGNFGIACILPSEDRIMFFNAKNNLQSLEFNHNASYSNAGKSLYFGGIHGLNHIDPLMVVPDKAAPVVKLISLFVSDTAFSAGIPPVNPDFKLNRLAPHVNGKVFSPDYMNVGSLLYSFYLEGYQKEWSKPSTTSTFTYRNLPPGQYRLLVKCADTYLNWSKPEALMSFTIKPAFYKTLWFNILLTLSLIVITIFIVKKIQRIRYQNQFRDMEREFAIEKERLRISKDMHDEVGASLTRISILSELAKKQQNEPEKERQIINQISEISGDVVDEMSEIIWAMNPRNDKLDSFTSYIRQHASSYLESAEIEGKFTFPDEIPSYPMSSELRRNLFLTVKEAFHNIVKHSGAGNVHMSLYIEKLMLKIRIEDDGTGFNQNNIRGWGNGLANMRKRIEELGGSFKINSEVGKGTSIEFSVKLREKNNSH